MPNIGSPSGLSLEGGTLAGAVDGVFTGLVIENSQAAAGGSTNETAEIKFGFGGNTDVARISADKLSDYTTEADEDARLSFWVDSDGTLTQIAHFMPDGLMLLLGDSRIRFAGTAGGGGQSIQYKDSGQSNRAAFLFPGSDVVAVVNRAANGTVEIRANTSTGGNSGEVIVATFEDDRITFDTDDLMVALAASPPSPDAGTVHIWNGNAGTISATISGTLVLEGSGNTSLDFLVPDVSAAGIRVVTPTASGHGAFLLNADASGQWSLRAGGDITRILFSEDEMAFQQDSTISSIGDLTLNPAGSLLLANDLEVTEGGTGAGTFADHGVMLGSGTGPLSVTDPGILGEILTSNGPSADPTYQVAAAALERRSISTAWETSARFQQAVLQAGAVTFDATGVTVSSGGTQAGSAKVRFTGQSTQLHRIDNSLNPAVYIEASIVAAGTDAQAYWGFQDLVMDGTSITFTGRHTGIKVIRVSSSDTVSATNADGTTEQATEFTWAVDDIHGRFYIKKTAVNATYYLDGVLKVTETDNLDVGNNTNGISIMGNNANTATTVSWRSSGAMLSEDAGP